MTRGSRSRQDFGRYLDVDGDGIPYRTYPGTHPTKGAFFTRGTSRDRYARYSEEGRLCRQHAAAAAQVRDRQAILVPRPVLQANAAQADQIRRDLFRLDQRRRWTRRSSVLEARGPSSRPLRVRAFPFHSSVRASSPTTTGVRGRAEPRRAAALAARQRMLGIDPAGWCRSCTMTARRSPRASSPARSPTTRCAESRRPLRKVAS
jgi:hypothetical protein